MYRVLSTELLSGIHQQHAWSFRCVFLVPLTQGIMVPVIRGILYPRAWPPLQLSLSVQRSHSPLVPISPVFSTVANILGQL